jgi:group II intron reverse transcriptase/maturase/CRISPR-associated endonuclease Cas1
VSGEKTHRDFDLTVAFSHIMNKYSLFETLCQPQHLRRAWQLVKHKGAAGGIDKVTVEEFDRGAGGRLANLSEQLREGEYVPEPYLEVKVRKKSKEFRKLGLASVKDKIVQQAVRDLIEPLLDAQFVNASYAYRRGKSAYKAIQRVRHIIRVEHRHWQLRCDVDDFFDNIDHRILLKRLAPEVGDDRILELIRLWIRMARVKGDLSWQKVHKGIPQGGVLSPLLANFYLHAFDQFILQQELGYVRYADDFIVLGRKKQETERALHILQEYLQQELHLRLNEGSEPRPVKRGFEFLGVFFRGADTSVTPEKLEKLQNSLAEGLHWTLEGYDDDYAAKLRTLNFYYGRLLPEAQLEKLDQALGEALVYHFRQLLFKRQLKRSELNPGIFRPLRFFSESWQKNWRRQQRNLLKEIRKRPEKKPKEDPTDAKIRRKKREYLQKAAEAKELLITTPGVFLGKAMGKVVVKQRGNKLMEAPWAQVDNITIMSRGVTLSSDALYQCARNGVVIHLLDQRGRPYLQLMQSRGLSAELGLAQLKAYENDKGAYLARAFVSGKIRNQINLIKYFAKYERQRENTAPADLYLQRMQKVLEELRRRKGKDLEKLRGQLMAAEGRAAAAYWDYVKELLAEKVDFQGRQRQGARDPINSCLNYGYAILYARVWEAVTRAQLHPGLSYLHVPDQGSKPSLIFDLIEEFRVQAVDRPVLALIRKTGLPRMKDGFLEEESRKLLAQRVLRRLSSLERFRGQHMRLQDIILKQARDLARYLLDQQNSYKPYKGKW